MTYKLRFFADFCLALTASQTLIGGSLNKMKKINLSNPHIEALKPYMSARRIGGSGEVWLNANELPFPREPMQLDVSEYHRYPDRGPDQVQAAYAEYAEVKESEVLALRGADEAIDLLLRAFCESGKDNIMISSPTYGMYQVCADIQNANVIDVPLTRNWQLNVGEMITHDDVKLVFICNPNNPTSNSFPREDILSVVKHFAGKAVVAIDEAYIEFCPDQSLASMLNEHDNLAVIRTMSKAFGLAGVHVGYLIANDSVMSVMRKIAAPYPLADPCAQIASMALQDKHLALMNEQVGHINSIRNEFCAALDSFSAVIEVLPSVANFVLVKFSDCENAWQTLSEAGIVVRKIPHPRLEDAIRFSVGTKEEMAAVCDVLRVLN